MSIYAVIKADVVVNTILAEPEVIDTLQLDADTVVDITTTNPFPSIGWGYDSTQGVFINPAPSEPADDDN